MANKLTEEEKVYFDAAQKFVYESFNNREEAPISPRYKNFLCKELPTPDGDRVYLMVIPPGDSMFISIEQTHAIAYIGRPENDEHPPNAIFVRQDIFNLKNCRTRIAEVAMAVYHHMKTGEREGMQYYRTAGVESFKEFISSYKSRDDTPNRNSIRNIIVTDKLTTDFIKAGYVLIITPEFLERLTSEPKKEKEQEKQLPWSKLFAQQLSKHCLECKIKQKKLAV